MPELFANKLVLPALALGGAGGAVARYMVLQTIARFPPDSFPWGTFSVNILGSLVAGVFFSLLNDGLLTPPSAHKFLFLLIITGFTGALTTFSTFALDVLLLWGKGYLITGLIYLVVSSLGCVFSAALGFFGMRLLSSLL